MAPQSFGSSSSAVSAIAHCRELLGDEAIGMLDTDVDAIRRHADSMARLIVDLFMQQRKP